MGDEEEYIQLSGNCWKTRRCWTSISFCSFSFTFFNSTCPQRRNAADSQLDRNITCLNLRQKCKE